MKPELLHDERTACRSDTARLLYYGILGVVDDAGRAKAAPAYLHGQVFWGRPRPLARVRAALAELVEHGLVSIYQAHGGEYLQVEEWHVIGSLTYQRVDKPQPSACPPPPENPHEQQSRDDRWNHSENGSRGRSAVAPGTIPLSFGDGSGSGSGSGSGTDQDQERSARTRPTSPTAAVDRFHSLYVAAYERKPTWGAKQVGQLKKLVAAHGIDETVRRMEIMFQHPPSWIRGPFDVGTLVQHFDKFVAVAVPDPRVARRGLTGDEIIAVGEEMDREMGIRS